MSLKAHHQKLCFGYGMEKMLCIFCPTSEVINEGGKVNVLSVHHGQGQKLGFLVW